MQDTFTREQAEAELTYCHLQASYWQHRALLDGSMGVPYAKERYLYAVRDVNILRSALGWDSFLEVDDRIGLGILGV